MFLMRKDKVAVDRSPHSSRVDRHERLGYDTGPSIQAQLHFTNLLVNLFHELNHEVHQFMLQHLFSVKVCYQETNIISLHPYSMFNEIMSLISSKLTGTALRRKTKKFSARCIKNRVNLWQRIFSISSACLILMLTRTALMEHSISTFSFSLRLTTTGVNIASLLTLQ